MKKAVVCHWLLGIILLVNGCTRQQAASNQANKADKLALDRKDIEGTWVLICFKNPQDSAFTYMKAPNRSTKMFTASHFSFAIYSIENKKFDMAGGGTYQLAGNTYTEQIEYFTLDSSWVGRRLEFTLQLHKDTLHQVRILRDGRKMEEYWKRISTQ